MNARTNAGVDFWLGDRGEGKVTDFDWRLRSGRVLKRIQFAGNEQASHLLVHVDPPLPLASGKVVNHVVLDARWEGSDLEDLPVAAGGAEMGYLAVYIYEVLDDKAVAADVVDPGAMRMEWFARSHASPNCCRAHRKRTSTRLTGSSSDSLRERETQTCR